MPRPWTVLSPSRIEPLAEGLWCVTDQIPGLAGVPRRMTIVRRADGGLLFYNAIPLRDEQLDELGRLGTPAQLLLPCHFHALDAHAFSSRLRLAVFAPEPGLAKVREAMPQAQPLRELPADPDLTVRTVDGFSTGEGLLLVKRPSGTSLVVADVVTNVAPSSSLKGLVMRLVGFTAKHPVLPPPVRRRVGRDLAQVKQLLGELAQTPGLNRVVPSHGEVLEREVPEALRRVAATL